MQFLHSYALQDPLPAGDRAAEAAGDTDGGVDAEVPADAGVCAEARAAQELRGLQCAGGDHDQRAEDLQSAAVGAAHDDSGGTRTALLVPDTAIVTDQTRKQVLVVGRDGTVAAHMVEPGPLVGGLRVIESGLRPGDKVIVKGVQMAMPGQKVRPQPGKIVPTKAAPAASEEAARPVSRAASATFAN